MSHRRRAACASPLRSARCRQRLHLRRATLRRPLFWPMPATQRRSPHLVGTRRRDKTPHRPANTGEHLERHLIKPTAALQDPEKRGEDDTADKADLSPGDGKGDRPTPPTSPMRAPTPNHAAAQVSPMPTAPRIRLIHFFMAPPCTFDLHSGYLARQPLSELCYESSSPPVVRTRRPPFTALSGQPRSPQTPQR